MSRPLVSAALALFALIGLVPIGVMLARVGGDDLAAVLDERTLRLLGRTLVLGLSSAAIATAIGLPFGFLVARTDLPGAGWLRALGMVPLLLPPLMLAVVWTVLTDQPGVIVAIGILGLATFPLVSLFAARAFERIDARREEAALVAGGLSAVLRMELPLVLPAVLCGACLSFAFAINDFAVPDFVTFMGRKFNVYADQVFSSWRQTQDPGKAVASALPLVAISLAALVPALALRRRGALATLDGDFRSPRPLALGRGRWPCFAFCLAVVVVGALIPLAQLAWEAAGGPALLRDPAGPRGAALVPALGEKLRASFAIAIDRMRGDLRNSLLFSAAAATIVVPIGLVLGHAIERARSRGLGRALELAALLPLAVPAVLFGMGFLVAWSTPAVAFVYDQPIAAVLLFAGRYSTFAVLVLSGAVASLHPRLEEAGAVAGARPATRMLHIVAPGLRGALVASWILVFVFSMRELDSAILVAAANKTAVFRVFNSVHFGRDSFVAAMMLLLVFTILLPGILWMLFARKRLEVLA